MASSSTQPRIGVGVFILNSSNEFLIGRRKGSLGSGTYALVGGHLEFGETFEECATREALEEAGIDILNLRLLTATNSVFRGQGQDRHYVTIFMVATIRKEDETKVETREPDRCEGWQWISWKTMVEWASGDDKRPLFQPMTDLLRQRPGVVPTR
ncbi:hypothetical protein DV735_g5764, partial [Chaetothyriales sp. CBS 134920]